MNVVLRVSKSNTKVAPYNQKPLNHTDYFSTNAETTGNLLLEQRKAFDSFADRMNIQKQEDWKSVNYKKDKLLKRIIQKEYSNSFITALQQTYPEMDWYPWSVTCPSGFWMSIQNQRAYFDWVAAALGILQQQHWYQINFNELHPKYRGLQISQYYGCAVSSILPKVYSEFTWYPWLFTQSPPGYWKDRNNQQKYLNWLAEELQIDSPEEWLTLQQKDFKHGGGLLQVYDGSIARMVSTLYPNLDLQLWKAPSCPDEFWMNIRNQRRFLEWFADEHSIERMEQWYSIGIGTLQKHGKVLLEQYNNSIELMLKTVFPEYAWRSKFVTSNSSQKFSVYEQRLKLEKLADRMNIENQSGWYKVTHRDFLNNGVRGILEHYGRSRVKTLEALFPEYKWLPWLFAQSPRFFWSNPKNITSFLLWTEEKLGISSIEDWYKVPYSVLYKMGGNSPLKGVGLLNLLKKYHPMGTRNTTTQNTLSYTKSQQVLLRVVKSTFQTYATRPSHTVN